MIQANKFPEIAHKIENRDIELAKKLSDKNPLKYLENIINGNDGDNPGDTKMIQDGINDYKESYK